MLKKISFCAMFFALCPLLLFSQAPDTLWTRTFGGAASDAGSSAQQTTDEGYIITGNTSGDVYLIKTDSLGDTLWTKTFGGTAYDMGSSVKQTTDGGYVISGRTSSFGVGPGDVYLIKTDSLGDTLWTKTFGDTAFEIGVCVQQTTDGGYIVTGETGSYGAGGSDVYLIKTDSLGDTLWTKTFGGTDYDCGWSVQQTTDGGYIITGETSSFGAGSGDAYLIKTDSLGDTLWTKTFGGTDYECGMSVRQIIDGGYIVTGETFSYGAGSCDAYLIKTDSLGDTLWTRTFGGSSSDAGYSVQQTTNGGYIITGFTSGYGASFDVYLIKTDSLGDTLWTKILGGPDIDVAASVQQTTDGGYIVCGQTASYGSGSTDVWLLKIAPDTFGIKEQKIRLVKYDYQAATIFSGPLLLPEGINCRVFDITGRTVVPEKIKPGIYFIEIDGVIMQKVVKIR